MKQNKKSTQVTFDKFNDAKIANTTSVVGGHSSGQGSYTGMIQAM